MRILALDLGTNCGYAISLDGERVHARGAFSFKSRRYEGGGMRYLRFSEKLREIHQANPLDQIIFEEVRRHMSTDAAHVYGGLLGVLSAFGEEYKIPYEGYPVQHIKMFATGRGNAKKGAVVSAMVAKGFDVTSEDEADALALLLLRLSQLPKTPQIDLLG